MAGLTGGLALGVAGWLGLVSGALLLALVLVLRRAWREQRPEPAGASPGPLTIHEARRGDVLEVPLAADHGGEHARFTVERIDRYERTSRRYRLVLAGRTAGGPVRLEWEDSDELRAWLVPPEPAPLLAELGLDEARLTALDPAGATIELEGVRHDLAEHGRAMLFDDEREPAIAVDLWRFRSADGRCEVTVERGPTLAVRRSFAVDVQRLVIRR